MSEWVERTCMIASIWRTSDASILELFRSAEPALADRHVFIQTVTDWLRAHTDVIEQWSGYSQDKRTSPSPYFQFDGRDDDHAACEVGFFDAAEGRLDVRQHTDPARACADFLYREASWVLQRKRAS